MEVWGLSKRLNQLTPDRWVGGIGLGDHFLLKLLCPHLEYDNG